MEILADKHNDILQFIEKHSRQYTQKQIYDNVPCAQEDFLYLYSDKKYIRGWLDSTFSLSGDGETYLATLREFLTDKHNTRKQARIAFWVSLVALAIALSELIAHIFL